MALTKITGSGISNSAVTTAKINDSAVTTAKIADGTIVNADVNAGAAIDTTKTGLGSFPTITSFTPTTLDDDTGGNITITGTNFTSIPEVTIVNTSTGSITTASAVTFTNSTTLTAAIPSGGGSGVYKVRVQNPNGLAAQSGDTLTYSSNPNWVTASGSLGTFAAGASISTSVLAYGDDSTSVTYSETTSVLTSNSDTPNSTMNLTLNSSTGAITGTAPAATAQTTYNFTIRATDAESQTADRAFSITVTVGINNAGQVN